MFNQFQNEIFATIVILLFLIIYLLLKNKKQEHHHKEELSVTQKEYLNTNKTHDIKADKSVEKTPIPSFEEIQNENLSGSQEGEFTEIKEKKRVQKSIQKRKLLKHGKITKQNFSEFSGSRILVAEDNFINQKVILGLLADSGIDVVLANDGQEVLDILEKDNNFFMILMDAHMPILDGFEATKAIRKQEKYDNIVIIALSGDTAADDVKKMRDAGMDENLEKPLRMEKLYNFMYIYSANTENDQEFIEVVMTQELRGDKGLEVCAGDECFYKEILQEFINDYANSADKLSSLFAQKRIHEMDKLLLDILGITANIGAVQLNTLAHDMKVVLDEADETSFLELISYYKTHLSTLIADIKDYI